jgi:hypothetical protein
MFWVSIIALEVFMNYQTFLLPLFMVSGVILFLFLGLRGIIKNRPLVINTGVITMVIFVPIIIDCIVALFRAGTNDMLPLFFIFIPSFLLLLLCFVVSWFTAKNYGIYFVADSDFRDAVLFALKNNSIVGQFFFEVRK